MYIFIDIPFLSPSEMNYTCFPTRYSRNAPVHTWSLHWEPHFDSEPLTRPPQGVQAPISPHPSPPSTQPLPARAIYPPLHASPAPGATHTDNLFVPSYFLNDRNLDFALFTLPQHRTNALPSNSIPIPCSQQGLYIWIASQGAPTGATQATSSHTPHGCRSRAWRRNGSHLTGCLKRINVLSVLNRCIWMWAPIWDAVWVSNR